MAVPTTKLNKLKLLLGIEASDTSQDDLLNTYLNLSEEEILNWMYVKFPSVPEDTEMPDKYEIVQIQSVIAGYN